MSTHEDFSRHEAPAGASDRGFGWVFTVFFAAVGIWPVLFGRSVRWWSLAASAIVLLATLVRPSVLQPANRLWMKFGLLLSRITNPIVTGLLFYLVFTPLGLLMRLLGKDLLRLRFESGAASYWIERRPPGPQPESMKQQF